MRRSFWWGLIVMVAIVGAPLVGAFGGPAVAVQAAPAAPAVPPPDDEVIVLTAAGQVRVYDPDWADGYKQFNWDSGAETGFTAVAAGDFNGDGDAEIVAARGSFVKVFDPLQQPGKAPVTFSVDLGSGRNVRLLVTGDFDADGKDEFAVMHYIPGTGVQAGLRVFDGGADASAGQWQQRNSADYGAMFQDMSTGDFNADGADDLVMVRNSSTERLVLAWNVRTWTAIAEGNYSRTWYAAAGGNLSASTPGDEIALLRNGANAQTEGLILFRVSSGTLVDLATSPTWRWDPEFTSIANGDLNGDGDDEVVMLRDPVDPKVSLLTVNPSGAAMNPFEQATGAGSAAFKLVRTGDVDRDGRDEIVILKADRFRIYTEPQVDSRATETAGGFYVTSSVNNLPHMALANIDGPGIPLGPALGVSPTSLSFALEYHQPSDTKNVSITNAGTSDVLNWQAEVVTAGASWLRLSQTNGTTPGTLGVSVDTAVITPGNYTGKIRISATGGSGTIQGTPQEVTVNVTITGVSLVVAPKLMNFQIEYGQVVTPQSLSITSQGGSSSFAWRATILAGAEWLLVNPMEGTTPTSAKISVNSRAVPPGDYEGTIKIAALDAQVADPVQYVTVRLKVLDAGLVVAPAQVMIKHVVGAPASTAQVQIERPGIPTPWTATVLPVALADVARAKLAAGEYKVTEAGIVFDGLEAPALDWLTITPTNGTTPSPMTLTVQGSTPGTYKAVVFVNSSAGTQEVHVTGWIANRFYAVHVPLALK